MSDAKNPPPISGDDLPSRNGCLTAVMFIFGVMLLGPGLCSLIFGGVVALSERPFQGGVVPFMGVALLAAVLGAIVIREAIRKA